MKRRSTPASKLAAMKTKTLATLSVLGLIAVFAPRAQAGSSFHISIGFPVAVAAPVLVAPPGGCPPRVVVYSRACAPVYRPAVCYPARPVWTHGHGHAHGSQYHGYLVHGRRYR